MLDEDEAPDEPTAELDETPEPVVSGDHQHEWKTIEPLGPSDVLARRNSKCVICGAGRWVL